MRLIVSLVVCCCGVAGCIPGSPKIDNDEIIRKNGGYELLKIEAEAAFKVIDRAKTSTVDPTNYAGVIKALMPQIVAIHEVQPPVLMIQTMGGFSHSGVLVVLGTNTNHKPNIGHGWVRKELAPGVFEFRE